MLKGMSPYDLGFLLYSLSNYLWKVLTRKVNQ